MSLVINDDIMRREALHLLTQINEQIEEVKTVAHEMGVPISRLRDSTGNWPLIPLLSAKVQCYGMLVDLQTRRKT